MTYVPKKEVVATINYLPAILLPKLPRRIFPRVGMDVAGKGDDVTNLLCPGLTATVISFFFLCFPYGNILQKKLTILINMFPVVVPLFKGLSLFSYRVYHSSSVPPIPLLLELSLVSIGSCSDSVYKPLAYLLKSTKKSSNSNPICAALFNLGMTDVSG